MAGTMGCYLAQSDPPQVVFGGGWDNPSKVFLWDVANNSTSELDDTPSGTRGMQFHIMEDGSTVLGVSVSRQIFSVDYTQSAGSVFTKITNANTSLVENHSPPMSMLVPRKTATCSE